jgi:para-aminobenzoate synthetase component 1
VIHAPGDRSASASATRTGTTAPVRLEPLPELVSVRPIDAAEALRGLPGLALLETARPGRRARWSYLTADPVAVLESPAAGKDPFADARRLVGRLASAAPDGGVADADAPPFLGGLVGYLAYDLGHALERLPTIAADDQGLPLLRLALHDWVIAWDRRTGATWIGGRALDGDAGRLDRRLAEVRERLLAPPSSAAASDDVVVPTDFTSSLDRPAYERGVEAVRAFIARGDIYQANLTRRLSAPFAGDPWPLYRRLRTGDPSLYAAYLDLGRDRAILSASPEPFIAVDRSGRVTTDPIKGTRPRGRTRDEDRGLACELLASEKDRAENVMIVDVLRNDLGRVCAPGTVRVPRLCRLERTAAVQHLVSTVTGRLARGRDAFDLLAASFPGGSITGAPKIRAMELLEELEPVRRGPYTGSLGWIGPDGAMASSILIRTFVADGSRFATASSDGRIRIWESSTQKLSAEPFARSAFDVRGVLLDGDDVLAGDEKGRLLVTSADGPARPTSFAPLGAQVVDASLASGTLATLGSDQQMQVWSRGGEPIARVIDEHVKGAYALAASPDGTRIATGDGMGNVRLFSATTGERELGPIRLHDGTVWGLAFSEDGTRLASGGEDGDVQVIDAETGEQLASPPRSRDAISSVLFVDGRLLAGRADGMVGIWEGATLAGELGPHGAGVTAMALSPGGVLAVADRQGGVAFWDVDRRAAADKPIAADDNTIWGLAWSADGSILATASDDEVVQLWDVESRTLTETLTPQPGGAAGAAFLSDGATIATTGRQGSVRLWDVSEAVPLGGELMGHEKSVWRVVALPRARLATSSEDGTVRIWDVLDPDRACERAEGSLGLDALGAFLGEGEEPVACGRE